MIVAALAVVALVLAPVGAQARRDRGGGAAHAAPGGAAGNAASPAVRGHRVGRGGARAQASDGDDGGRGRGRGHHAQRPGGGRGDGGGRGTGQVRVRGGEDDGGGEGRGDEAAPRRTSASGAGGSDDRREEEGPAPAAAATTATPAPTATAPPAAQPVAPAAPAGGPPANAGSPTPSDPTTPGGAPGGPLSSGGGGVADTTFDTPFGGTSLGGPVAPGIPGAAGREDPESRGSRPRSRNPITRTVVRTVQRAVEVIPGYVWALIGTLAGLSLLGAAASALLAARGRRLARQREALLADVGVLQRALLPDEPEQIAGAAATAAYRPGRGRNAGGDFYDVFAIDHERLAMVVGRVSTGGRPALGVTALIRHVLRAYLEGGLQPRNALQVAADVLEHHLGADYATVTAAIYDRAASQLTFAGAGTPPPVVLGAAAFEPVTACAAAPVGMGVPTGTRQTSVVLPAGAVACFYTEGLVDAATQDGRYGYRRLWRALKGLGPEPAAGGLLGRVSAEARGADDMAAVVLHVGAGAPAATPDGGRRVEELELSARELTGERPGLFLRDCGVPTDRISPLTEELRETGRRLGGAVLRVRYGPGVPEAETALRSMDVLHVPASPAREPQATA